MRRRRKDHAVESSRVESSHRAGRVHIIHSLPFIRMARGASSHLFFVLCVCVCVCVLLSPLRAIFGMLFDYAGCHVCRMSCMYVYVNCQLLDGGDDYYDLSEVSLYLMGGYWVDT